MGKLYVQGQKEPRSFTWIADTEKVTIQHVTQCGDGKKVVMGFTLDLAGLSKKDLYEHAATNIVIQWIRPRLLRKKTSDEVIKMDGTTLLAALYKPTGERVAADPATVIRTVVTKLPKDAWIEFMMDAGMTIKQAEASWAKKHPETVAK